jgi:hypothetical protein
MSGFCAKRTWLVNAALLRVKTLGGIQIRVCENFNIYIFTYSNKREKRVITIFFKDE